MEKLTIIDDGIKKKIGFSDRFAKGIYTVFDKKQILKNCTVLNIQLEKPSSDLEMIQKVTVIGKAGIVTINLDKDYYQYILMPSAERDDFLEFKRNIPEPSHGALNAAFNQRSMNNLNDLDFLGSGLSNKN